jgi:hypothetical protein
MYLQYLKREKDSHALTDFQLTLAKDKKNVLIFMLDGFSGGALKHIEDNSREILNGFDGFTWYKNVVTGGTGTWGVIATLYGGHKYSIEEINSKVQQKPLHDYFVEAYNFYPRVFTPQGYKVKYVNTPYLDASEIDKNVEYYKMMSIESNSIFDNFETTRNIYNEGIPLLVSALTIFNAIPNTFKKFVYDNGMYHGIRNKNPVPYKIYEWSSFLNIANRIKVIDTSTFNFIALLIPHSPNIMDSQCNYVIKTKYTDLHTAYLNEATCSIKTISKIIMRMKELQVYDNTMIALVSDHGWWMENKMFKENYAKKVPAGDGYRLISGMVSPLLIVKDINSRGEIRTSDIFLSNADLPSIVCSVFDSNGGIPTDFRKHKGKRKFIVNSYNPDTSNNFLSDIGFKGIIEKYEVTDNIFDGDNWKKIDQ